MEDKMELEFFKLNLKENDSLVVKVNTANLTEDQAVEKLKSVSEDPFITYVKEKGHNVFVTYTGVDVQILRFEDGDKLMVYCDVSTFTDEETKEKYLSYVKEKLNVLEDKLVVVPVEGANPQFRMVKESQLSNVEEESV